MAYLNKDDVAAIRKELNETFPEFKFGVVKRDCHAVTVTIKAGPRDFSSIFQDEYSQKRQYAQINAYHLDKFYGEHANFFGKIIKIIKTAPARGEGYRKGEGWYDRSDAQVDYFDTAYYINLNVGAWDKPYQVVAPKAPVAKKPAKTTTVKARSGSVRFARITEVSGYDPRDNTEPDPAFSYVATVEQLLAQ